jgi:hypothetical protein
LPDLNSLDFSRSLALQAKDQAIPRSNLATLFPTIAAEWDASSSIYLQNMPLILLPLRKMKFELNRCLANSPAHTNQYFSGLKEASIRHESLYIEKNNILVHN